MPTPYVWPVTAAEVRAELNLGADLSQDDELAGFIASLSRVVEAVVGPVAPTPYVEWCDGSNDRVVLKHYPVLSVEAVAEYSRGVAQVLADEPLDTTAVFTHAGYQVVPETGEVIRTSGGVPYRFARGTRNVKVSYTAGKPEVYGNLREAVLELIRLHWRPQRTGGPATIGSRGDDSDSDGQTILGFFVPGKVLDLLLPDRRAPSVG